MKDIGRLGAGCIHVQNAVTDTKQTLLEDRKKLLHSSRQ